MSYIMPRLYDGGDRDMDCPYCGSGISIKWNTEYGDADIGEHHVVCPKCKEDIHFECWVQYQVL
ncbi:MAG: hypothetical protein WC479_10175, partial [Candidatus Izemoplasmatales bacterium]